MEDSLCRASDSDLEGAANEDDIIKPEAIKINIEEDNSFILRQSKITMEEKRLQKSGKLTTMSVADSYQPEHIAAKQTKLSIFGDPWDVSKTRNKNLISQLNKAWQ